MGVISILFENINISFRCLAYLLCFLIPTLFQSCFSWSFVFTLDVFFKCLGILAYLLLLKKPTESSTGRACGSRSFLRVTWPGSFLEEILVSISVMLFSQAGQNPQTRLFQFLAWQIYALLPIF